MEGPVSGDGLLRWLAQAKLVPAHAQDDSKARAIAGDWTRLRIRLQALRGFVRKHIGRPLTTKALNEFNCLNRLLERDEALSRISAGIAIILSIAWSCK